MNRDLTPSKFSALVVPFDADIWPDHSTYTQAGPRAGVPVPTDGEGASKLALAARGTQTGDIQVRSQRGGFATRDAEESGAGFLWRDATVSGSTVTYGAWRGWEPPRNVSRFDPLIVSESAAGVIRYTKKPSAVVCADGSVLVAVEVRDTSQALPYQIAIWKRSTTSDTWARVSSPYGQTSAPTWDFCPCLVVLDSGRIVLYYALYDSVLSGGAVSAWYSDDSGSTWSFVGDGLADTNFAATITTLTGAQKDGVVLLCAFTSGTGDVYQFASTDFGNSLLLVEQFNPALAVLACAVTATPSGFLVAINQTTNGTVGYRLGDAFSPLSGATYETIRSGTTFTPGLAIACDESGVLYAYPFQTSFVDPYYSFDDGASWQGYTGPAYTLDYTGSASFSMDSFCAVAVRGQVILLGSYAAGSTTYAGLRAWTLGGYSTVTLPRYARTFLPKAVQGFNVHWAPVNLPERMSWTRTATPPAVIASVATGALVITTTAEQEWYSQSPATSNVAGFHFRCVLSVTTAAAFGDGLSARLQLDDGTNRFGVRLQWTTTQWRLVDDVSGATIGVAQNFTGRVEILVGFNVPAATAATAGNVATWARRVDVTTQSGVREWTAGPSSLTVTRAAPTTPAVATHRVQWGHRAAGTYVSTWYEVAYAAGATSINVQLAQGQVSPDDLFARPFASSGSGVYVASGVSVEARGGPTWLGESWKIFRRYDYGIERALQFPSPRHAWVSTSNAETVSLLWDDGIALGTNNYASRGLIAVYLGNCNAETVAISYRNVAGASWVLLGTVDRCSGLTGLSFDCMNASIRPAADSSLLLRTNEFTGSWFVDATGATQTVISGNSEGKWSATAPLRAMLHLESTSGTATGRTGGKIVPKDSVILVDLSNINTPAIKLTFSKSSTAAALQCGVLRLGEVIGLGTRYDWGRTLDLDLEGAEVAEAKDRTRRAVAAAPPRRVVSVAWAETAIDQTDADRYGDPDYILGAAQAIAGVQTTAYTLEGVAREINGAVDPLVYLPSVPATAPLQVLNRRGQMLYGRLTSNVSIETVLGEENDSELVRIATLELSEEV